ncbi:MAG: hypothetical protein AB7G76_02480 [Steroidobacteraceae bacterium]
MNTASRLSSALLGLALVAGCTAPAREAPAAAQIDVAKMASAERLSEKIGVPADVRYAFSGDGVAGAPAQLQVAIIPRTDGNNLRVEFPATAGVSLHQSTAAQTFGKASAAAAYRLSVAVSAGSQAPAKLPVIVSMDTAAGRFFTVFGIPLRASGTAR